MKTANENISLHVFVLSDFREAATNHTECDICFAPMRGMHPRHRHCCSAPCAREAYA